MPSPLEPILRMPMELDPFGLPRTTCEFVPGQDAMIIQSLSLPSGVVAWSLRNAPSLALGLLLAVTLVWLWIVVRAWRRPRQRGRIYCRCCNYELTAPLAVWTQRRMIHVERGAKCPECGAELAVRRPVRGRSRLARVVPATVVAAPMSVFCVLVLFLMLEPYSGPPSRPWPGLWILSVAPRLAYQTVSVGPEWVFRFDRIELDGRGRRRKLAESTAWYIDVLRVHVSPDGRWIVTEGGRVSNDTRHIARIDTSTGAVERTVMLHGDVQSIVGWSDDGQHVLASVMHSDSSVDEPSLTLVAVHVDSLRVRTIATLHWPAKIDAAGTRHGPLLDYCMLAWPRTQADPDWVAVALDCCDPMAVTAVPAKGKMIVCRAGHLREWPITAPCSDWYYVSLADGGRVLALDGHTLAGTANRLAIDLASGDLGPNGHRAPTIDYTEDGRYRVNAQVPAMATLTRSTDGALLATVRIPQPDTSQWGTAGRPVVSADERWLAYIALEPEVIPEATPPNAWRPVIYVWDLKRPGADQPSSPP